MRSKTSVVLGRTKFKFHGIDSNKRLTKLFRDSLGRSWLHPYVRLRKFARDYSLPLAMTLVFLAIVSAALFLRVSQRSSLADLLAGVTITGQDYGTLLSGDKAAEIKRNNDNADPTPNAPTRAQAPLAINTATGTAAGNTGTAGGNNQANTGGNGSSNGGNGSTPSPPFTASITSFQHDSTNLECSTPKPKQQTCSKRYNFSGRIRTQNGPGNVDYGWRSNLQAGTEDGSITAGTGDITTPVQKSLTLACTSPTNFTMQLTIFSPALSQSATLNVVHNCNEI